MIPVPVLCYHSIAELGAGGDRRFAVGPERFRDHLRFLRGAGYSFITFAQLIASRQGHFDLPQPAVVLTFDDGHATLLDNALPALTEARATATVFVTTGAMAERPSSDPIRFLSLDEVGELASAGIEIGAHGHRHLAHDVIHGAQLRAEIATPRQVLGDFLGEPPMSYAYPYGYSSQEARSMVAAVGYTGASGMRHALSGAGDDPFDVGRVRVTAATTAGRLDRWLRGPRRRISPCSDQLTTRVYRPVRRLRHRLLP